MTEDQMAYMTNEVLFVLPLVAEDVASNAEVLVAVRLGEEGGASLPFPPLSAGNLTADLLSLDDPQWTFSITNIILTIFASLVIFCTLVGNSLVITAVIRERTLRKVGNSFIISLAVSDLLVGTLVTPMALVYQLHGHWIFSDGLCDFWIFLDVVCCTASIANLCAISYDRYNAIKEPLRYAPKRTWRRAVLFIAMVWLYSVAIAMPPFLGWGAAARDQVDTRHCTISQNRGYTVYSTTGAFYLPLLFMLFAYICIYRETSRRTRQWRRGPGSSKVISEQDGESHAMSLRLVHTAGEPSQLLSSPSRNIPPPYSGVGYGSRRTSGSGAFLRNSSLTSHHSVHYENAIPEVDETTRREASSGDGSGGSSVGPNPSPSSSTPLHPARAADPTPEKSAPTAPPDRRPVQRTPGSSRPRHLIRQVSSLTSSDSSTVTSTSSSLITTSSSSCDLPPPDPSASERRRFSSSMLIRQNTAVSVESQRKESWPLRDHEKVGSSRRRESTRKSVTFIAPPLPTMATDDISAKKDNHCSIHAQHSGNQGMVTVTAKSEDKKSRADKECKKMSVSQEKRAARTLSAVLGCFIVCWLPFFLVALLKPLCRTCHVHRVVNWVVLWLGYANSALNPIIYTCFNNHFRYAFRRMLHCACRRRRRRHRTVYL